MMPPCKNFFAGQEVIGNVARYKALFCISNSEAPSANSNQQKFKTKPEPAQFNPRLDQPTLRLLTFPFQFRQNCDLAPLSNSGVGSSACHIYDNSGGGGGGGGSGAGAGGGGAGGDIDVNGGRGWSW